VATLRSGAGSGRSRAPPPVSSDHLGAQLAPPATATHPLPLSAVRADASTLRARRFAAGLSPFDHLRMSFVVEYLVRRGVRRSLMLAVAGLMVVALVLPVVALAGSDRHAVGNPSISLIIFGGSPTNPDITIRGTDLDYQPYHPIPPKVPNNTPSNQKLRPVAIKGIPGYDYGQKLFFVDKSAKPVWSAGRYRPALGELDCIGIIVTTYTSGESSSTSAATSSKATTASIPATSSASR